MVKHIVLWRLHAHAEGHDREHNAQQAKAMLEALRGRIEGLLHLEVGRDFSAGAQSADLLLYSEFTDRAALAHYQRHPEHEAVKPFIAAITCERRVVDYDI